MAAENSLNVLFMIGVSIGFQGAVGAYQTDSSTVFNGQVSSLAVDANPGTCFMSGFGTTEWFTLDLGGEHDVQGVTVTGIGDSFEIRVGDAKDEYGIRDGFQINPLCAVMSTGIGSVGPSGSIPSTQTITCRRVMTGRYISILTVSFTNVEQLILCDVSPILNN